MVVKKETFESIEAELKKDPVLKQYLVPVPDYGMLSIILLKRILDKLSEK
jgi:hypothetical protein